MQDDENDTCFKNIKSMSSPNNNVMHMITNWMKTNNIKYSCAPFEADHKCVCLEKTCQFEAMMSRHGDCVTLGVEHLYYNINFNEQKLQAYCKAKNIINKELNPLFNYEE